MKLAVGLFLLLTIFGLEKNPANSMTTIDTLQHSAPVQLTFLALGDSYTIGHDVPEEQNFPHQLTALLNANGLHVTDPTLIAKTGWTTDELISAIQSATIAPKYDLVTLLIGVNNQYRAYSIDTYRIEFKKLLKTAVNFAGGNKAHVFVLSIPDWGATPFGAESGRGPENIGKEIDAYNAINREESLKAGVKYTDITPGSKKAVKDVSLVASDGLHPSGKMYKEWASLLAPAVLKTYK
ncbi:SGNH/GDSL hydrolase family protein [Pedobacter sp. L105]|uniref:SGNH/GDSL hydrolase family protein n=1 Tax=Pedobacter sp. L105 TaxID=1641871 RepID=UPI00131B963A|nr:SGNH/GDSL hydrolase family protein [Pedobacter sp. L105]